jgi:hypothetical protein
MRPARNLPVSSNNKYIGELSHGWLLLSVRPASGLFQAVTQLKIYLLKCNFLMPCLLTELLPAHLAGVVP